ncbi:MAG: peptidase S16 [Rhodospirillaceae bacterium]|nr:peptidase S16 [Rhodospirillaceae bacterium]
MSGPGFSTSYINLPSTLPIFPLEGVLLLPSGRLPLNVFEPRYLAMTDDALAAHRLIGIIQPTKSELGVQVPPVFHTGCAGRICAFSETDDGRYLITLSGVARFDVIEEIDAVRGYRRIVPDWSPYEIDCFGSGKLQLDKKRLLIALKSYFENKAINPDWEAIDRMDDVQLITTLAMICPFGPSEQQALLMAKEIQDCADTMMSLIEIATHEVSGADNVRH